MERMQAREILKLGITLSALDAMQDAKVVKHDAETDLWEGPWQEVATRCAGSLWVTTADITHLLKLPHDQGRSVGQRLKSLPLDSRIGMWGGIWDWQPTKSESRAAGQSYRRAIYRLDAALEAVDGTVTPAVLERMAMRLKQEDEMLLPAKPVEQQPCFKELACEAPAQCTPEPLERIAIALERIATAMERN